MRVSKRGPFVQFPTREKSKRECGAEPAESLMRVVNAAAAQQLPQLL